MNRTRSVGFVMAALTCLPAVGAQGQSALSPGAEARVNPAFHCSCGAHPPGPPADRTVAPYAGEPDDLRPYSKFAEPYFKHYLVPNIYSGAAREVPVPDLSSLTEIRIGFLGPLEKSSDAVFGQRMLHGAQMAIDDANAGGGYGGKPFRLMIHNDYDNWQAGQVYGAERPTEPTIWGSPSNEVVKMVYDERVWAIFGSISSESTHIILRVALRAEVPIVNSASTDPTIPETYIPWYWTDLQDDRVQNQVLARHIYGDLKLKRMAILRVNNRYGRFGVAKFRDASRRLGHPVVIEQKFRPGDTDYRHQLRVIQDSRADGILLWTDQIPTANILKQMRELGMKQRVLGGYRILGDDLLREAGAAAEGVEAVFPYDPSRSDPKWHQFNADYAAKFHEPPEQFAALAYDAMRALLDSVCRAGLNRARIHDALAGLETYDGVTGPMVFDPNSKNVAPMYIGVVHGGTIEYRRASLEKTTKVASTEDGPPSEAKTPVGAAPGLAAVTEPQRSNNSPAPYARIGDDPIDYSGPESQASSAEDVRVAVFGPGADLVIQSAGVAGVLRAFKDQHISLIAIPSGGPWGKASTGLVNALFEQKAVGIIALDRNSSHLAEQLALKSFVPVIALTDDATITSTNVPWIFRMEKGTGVSEALRCLLEAERAAGPNPNRIREELASGRQYAGVRFSSRGELRR